MHVLYKGHAFLKVLLWLCKAIKFTLLYVPLTQLIFV